MQPLGLTGPELDRYHEKLRSPHDFKIDVDVLHLDEKRRGTLSTQFLDGQVNIQRGATVKRTATLSFYDPDHSLNLDPDSPFDGAVFADRLIRVRHGLNLDGHGMVWATPFVGPITAVSRAGDVLSVTCEDKTALALEGCPPKTVRKGRNAVDAIEDIMRDCTGERRFRFPKKHRARLHRSYSVGWAAEASPWVVCQKIAKSINMELEYSCDGALMLRRKPRGTVVAFTDNGSLTGPLQAEYDVASVRNIVRVSGLRNKKKKIHVAAVAKASPNHPMSAQKRKRNGVPLWLPLLIDDQGIKKQSVARRRAQDELKDALPMAVTASFAGIPFFHLDYGDPIRVKSEWGDVTIPFVEGSIPLGLSGDAAFGAQRQVSRPRRRR